MESIIKRAISQWCQEKGVDETRIGNVKVRWSEPKFGFNSISFTVDGGPISLKIIEKGANLKIIEST
jgi:hypothetical protein